MSNNPASLRAHLLDAARQIFRPAQRLLKHPYLVPGGTYSDQLWDWDSFWVAKALLSLEGAIEADQKKAFLIHAEGSWKNMIENQGSNGVVPILGMPQNIDYFGCTRDPSFRKNQAKPVLAQFALEIGKAYGSHDWIKPYFPRLISFLESWRRHFLSPCGLLVWGSDVAIGVDNDPTVYGRPEFSSGSILLNCLYYCDLFACAEIARSIGEPSHADALEAHVKSLRDAIRSECWDPVDGFYYSVDTLCEDNRDVHIPADIPKGMAMSWKTLPLKIKLFTGFLPMWCGIATETEAQTLVERHYRNPSEFQAEWGLPSLALNEKMYAPHVESSNPSNWLGPVWIVANYMVWVGLQRYGYSRDASLLAQKTVALLTRDLEQTGTLHECYHPETGDPNFNSGFLSWNLLALLMDSPGAETLDSKADATAQFLAS